MLTYRDGNDSAFEILYHRYEKPILNFVHRIVMNMPEAENLCQETFFRVVRAKKTYEATAQFKTWLYQIALNLCRDRLRRKKHQLHLSLSSFVSSRKDEDVVLHDRISDPSANPKKNVEMDKMRIEVQAAVENLCEEEQFVVILREYQGLKLSEIADILDSPIGTVKSLNHRAHQKLKKALAKYLGD
jgi:RNA polymerase sigma-70 factor (ECF subfamily)